jgi:hypothetical protein
VKANSKQECYLCGKKASQTAEGTLTREHLPPKNLFPSPRPRLFTVPCCLACNNQAHNDDEYFRVAVSAGYNANETGKEIWKEKVKGRTLKEGRISESVNKIRSSLKKIALITPEGVKDAVEATIEHEPIDRVLTRITKGFLSRLYPEVNRSDLTFEITKLDQFKLNDPAFEIRKALNYFQIGNGVYRCWHVVEDYTDRGAWVHMFFDSAAFFVQQTSDRQIVLPWVIRRTPHDLWRQRERRKRG